MAGKALLRPSAQQAARHWFANGGDALYERPMKSTLTVFIAAILITLHASAAVRLRAGEYTSPDGRYSARVSPRPDGRGPDYPAGEYFNISIDTNDDPAMGLDFCFDATNELAYLVSDVGSFRMVKTYDEGDGVRYFHIVRDGLRVWRAYDIEFRINSNTGDLLSVSGTQKIARIHPVLGRELTDHIDCPRLLRDEERR